ncbi:MAG: TIGR02466 family protein, partial [Panacagrimonas sp.]
AKYAASNFARDVLKESRQIRDYDRAGQRWSKKGYPGGYTSYGSMDQLHRFSSGFDDLRKAIDRHVERYARALAWDLDRIELVMTDCWLNIMPKACAHSFHLHPQSAISGTYYAFVPKGAPGLRIEDPRLSCLMAAPPMRADVEEAMQRHVTLPARTGDLILFESWLRHEVPANPVKTERVSISFNYHWQ